MRIAHVLSCVSRMAGGVLPAVSGLAKAQAAMNGVQVEAFGSRDEFIPEDLRYWQPVRVHTASVIGPRRFCYTPSLTKMMDAFRPDLIHSATVWTWPAAAINGLHARRGIPFIASVHGTMDSWALRYSHWKKAIALRLFQQQHFDRAACIHVGQQFELDSVRAFGLKNPVCVIPNGVEIPEGNGASANEMERSPFAALSRQVCGRKVLLFLSRIHPKKGLVDLIRAWAAIQKTAERRDHRVDDWVLIIAGVDEVGHTQQLRLLVQEHGMQESVFFLGPQFGREKTAIFGLCDAFVLPSFSEGFPEAVLDAWAYGKPVLMTPECHIPEGFAAGAAIEIRHGADTAGMEAGLRQLFQSTNPELQAMGAKGRALVVERFTWPKIARAMQSVYDWILGGGSPPDCMQFQKQIK